MSKPKLIDAEKNKINSISVNGVTVTIDENRNVNLIIENNGTGDAPIQSITVNGNTVPIVDKTVALTIQTIYGSTSEPTASDGIDGDVWLVYEG